MRPTYDIEKHNPVDTLFERLLDQALVWSGVEPKLFEQSEVDLVEEEDEAPEVIAPPSMFASFISTALANAEENKKVEQISDIDISPELLSNLRPPHASPPWMTEEDKETAEAEDHGVAIVDQGLELPEPLNHVATTSVPVIGEGQSLITASSQQMENIEASDELVDKIFARMKPVLESTHKKEAVAQIETRLSVAEQRSMLAESRNEMTKVVRSELPQLMNKELRAMLKEEVITLFKSEIVQAIRSEFAEMGTKINQVSDRIQALEPRLAKLEGAADKDVTVNFPHGAVKVNVPITIPEREVKIAAPINVQPANVTIDKGAVSVNFHKDATPKPAKKKVKFNRDAYDKIIDAELVSEDDGGSK